MAKRPSTIFVCQECGAQSPKWLGRCADCGAWNSLVEERLTEMAGASAVGHRYGAASASTAQLYADIQIEQHARISTGIDEFDRVLGGGIVPGALEHVVDTVLYFEGERHHSHRVVRAVKNRFGAVSELGVFEMTSTGLRAVPNPSKLFLAERASNAPGSAVLCSVEGSRPILVEVQALVSSSMYGTARRMASGLDQQRLSLLLAVLEQRAGLNLAGDDVFVNIAGGMTVDEPASDLGVVAAIASSLRNRVIPSTTAVFGEVGLAGEVRGISQAALRVREATQMGFLQCVMPEANIERATDDEARDEGV